MVGTTIKVELKAHYESSGGATDKTEEIKFTFTSCTSMTWNDFNSLPTNTDRIARYAPDVNPTPVNFRDGHNVFYA
jgi:hypothetical protein